MRRVLAFVMCFLLASSLGLGSASHASEPVVSCIEASATTSLDHADGDSDQVPADAEKGYPHHHGGCHGHHVGVPLASNTIPLIADDRLARVSWEQAHGAGLVGDPALRPPQA